MPRRNLHTQTSSAQLNARSKRRLVNSMSLTMRINPDTPTNVLTFSPSNMPETLTLKFLLISLVVYFNVAITVVFCFREPARAVGLFPQPGYKYSALFLISKTFFTICEKFFKKSYFLPICVLTAFYSEDGTLFHPARVLPCTGLILAFPGMP